MCNLTPSFHAIRISIVSLTVLILAGCLEQPETSVPGVPDTGIAAAAKNFQTQYETLVQDDGHRVVFPVIPMAQLKARSKRVFALMRFRDGAKFNEKRLRLALNGIRGHHAVFSNFSSDAQWELDEDGYRLVVDLSSLQFRRSQDLLSRIARVQARGGEVQLWVTSPQPVESLQLRFGIEERVLTDSHLPRVIFDGIKYGSSAFFHRIGSLYFHADTPVRGFQCSLNYQPFRSCASPANYWLRPGYHVFRARAVSLHGQLGPVMIHHFKKHWHSVDVRITGTTPAESPTTSTKMAITFETRNNPPWFWWEWFLRLTYERRCHGKSAELGVCRWLKERLDGGHWGSVAECQLDGNGFVPCTSPVKYERLNEGPHTVVVRSLHDSDAADEYSWIVDRETPVLHWTEVPEAVTAQTSARFAFESEEDVDTFCSLDGAAFTRCESPVVLESLSESGHQFQVYGVDLAGNASETLSYVWRVDGGPPELTLTHVSPNEPLTSSRTIRFDFEADEPASFYCVVDAPIPAPTDLELHACTSPLELQELGEGAHSVHFIAVDTQGNQSEPLTYSWNIDATGPSVSLRLLFPISVPTSQPDAQFEFSIGEPASIACLLNGMDLGPCSSPFSVTDLSEGSHLFQVRAIDAAGNEGTSSFSWEVDRTAPVLELVSVVPAEPETESRSLELSFTVSEAAEVLCELDGGGQVECASPFLVNELEDGDHELIVTASDAVGNESEITYYWTVNSPVITTLDSITPVGSPTVFSDAVFEFSAPNAFSFECALDTSGFGPCSSPMAYTGLEDGEHRFEVRGLSASGEPGPIQSHTWTIDSTPLAISQVSVSQITRTTALITWTTNVAASSRVQYGMDGMGNTASSEELTTNHVVLLEGLLPNALYSFQVHSLDAASRPAESGVQSFRTLR